MHRSDCMYIFSREGSGHLIYSNRHLVCLDALPHYCETQPAYVCIYSAKNVNEVILCFTYFTCIASYNMRLRNELFILLVKRNLGWKLQWHLFYERNTMF